MLKELKRSFILKFLQIYIKKIINANIIKEYNFDNIEKLIEELDKNGYIEVIGIEKKSFMEIKETDIEKFYKLYGNLEGLVFNNGVILVLKNIIKEYGYEVKELEKINDNKFIIYFYLIKKINNEN